MDMWLKSLVTCMVAVLMLCVCAPVTAADEAMPSSPRDLHDIDAICAMSLDELRWTETARTVLPNGVTRIEGTFSSGPFKGLKFEDYDAGRYTTFTEINPRYPMVMFVPAGYPNVAGNGYLGAISTQGQQDEPLQAMAQRVAERTGLPMITHGCPTELWTSLGYKNITHLASSSRYWLYRIDSPSLDTLQCNLHAVLARKNFVCAYGRYAIA